MFDCFGEQLTSLVEIVAGIDQPLDLRAVLSPLLIPWAREIAPWLVTLAGLFRKTLVAELYSLRPPSL